MADSTAVFEEIQVYMETTGSREMEVVDVDADGNTMMDWRGSSGGFAVY